MVFVDQHRHRSKACLNRAIRQFLAEHPAEFDPRKYLAASMVAMKGIVKARYEDFGTAGNASKIKPLSLEAMADHYG